MRHSLTLLVVAAACLACSDSVAPAPANLVGRWSTTPETLHPAGSMQHHLSFASGGRFTFEVRSYGLYEGESPSELSAYSRTTGAFRTEGAHLIFTPDSLITWDRFYGGNSPESVQTPYPYDGLYDDARYTIEGDRLTLQYITYPADAPVATTQEYQRQR